MIFRTFLSVKNRDKGQGTRDKSDPDWIGTSAAHQQVTNPEVGEIIMLDCRAVGLLGREMWKLDCQVISMPGN